MRIQSFSTPMAVAWLQHSNMVANSLGNTQATASTSASSNTNAAPPAAVENFFLQIELLHRLVDMDGHAQHARNHHHFHFATPELRAGKLRAVALHATIAMYDLRFRGALGLGRTTACIACTSRTLSCGLHIVGGKRFALCLALHCRSKSTDQAASKRGSSQKHGCAHVYT